jgi:hypothetical protein
MSGISVVSIAPIHSKLSRCEPFAKELYREKAFPSYERCDLVVGHVSDSVVFACGWKSASSMPAWKHDVQGQVVRGHIARMNCRGILIPVDEGFWRQYSAG